MTRVWYRYKLTYLALLIGALLLSSLAVVINSERSSAANVKDWRAGSIIDDTIFYNKSSMTTAQIQSFLNSKNPSCDTWGTKQASEFGRPDITHAQYAKSKGWPGPPYICLKDYHQVPRSDKIINNYNSKATKPSGSISAATIIKRAADTYGVSPKVLLVLLQKESPGPLPIDSWPLQSQYKNAMGYACPDTAPCDPQYAGFYNQMMNAARQIKVYKDNPNSYRHKPFATATVYYHPDLSRCKNSNVYINTRATAGLYNYTPYQPNQKSLSSYPGTGDSCSSYGNRNFWFIFTDWFGSTRSQAYQKVAEPRWMEAKVNTNKKNLPDLSNQGDVAKQSVHLFFDTKATVKSNLYVRTKYDTSRNANTGLAVDNFKEIPYRPVDTPRWMIMSKNDTKRNPVTEKKISEGAKKDTPLFVSSKISVNGNPFLRTRYDTGRNIPYAMPTPSFKEATFKPAAEPRWMRYSASSAMRNPITEQVSTKKTTLHQQIFIDSKLQLDTLYLRAKGDSLAVATATVEEIPYSNLSANEKGTYKLKQATVKANPRTGKSLSSSDPNNLAKAGQSVSFSSKIVVNGVTYLRTAYDTSRNVNSAIPLSLLQKIP